jgi:predicted flap endonuclease-1-like 5' DNA nuclease
LAWFLGQSLVFILAAFLLGLLVGWLLWGRRRHAAAERGGEVAGDPAGIPGVNGAARVEVTVDTAGIPGANGAAPVKAIVEPAEVPGPAEADAANDDPVEADAVVPVDISDLVEVAPLLAGSEGGAVAGEPVAVGTLVLDPPAEAAPAEVAPAQAAPAEAAPAEAAPAEAVPDDVVPDDLRRIEGIGPKMSEALRRAGIQTYRQLADADVAALRRAIEAAGLTFAPSLTTWSRQARLLADGDEDGFADLARRLVAGRDVGRV